VAAVERLGDDQRYAVTPFEDTTLHDAGPTYVYLAALRAPGGNAQVQGGIAIVFHAAVELQAMLRDVLAGREGFAAFVDAQGRVLASTDPELASALVGTCAQSGETALVDHAGAHYACAQDRAAGYREFKTSDGYDNGVRTVVGLRLGGSERRGRQLGDSSLQMAAAAGRQQTVEAAVFQVGGSRYALPTHALLLAVSPQGLVRTPGSDGLHLGMVEVPEGRGTRLVQTLCARRLFGVSYPARAGDGALLVLRHPSRPEAPACTLRVDDVLAVLDVPCELLQPVPRAFARFAPWVSSLFQCLAVSAGQQEQIMVQMLDPASLLGVAQPDLNPGDAQEQPAVTSARAELADSAINA
jgi:chemotaxis signal transduction protein